MATAAPSPGAGLFTRKPPAAAADATSVTWQRFVLWLLAGLVIHGLYGRRHSALRRGEDLPDAPASAGVL